MRLFVPLSLLWLLWLLGGCVSQERYLIDGSRLAALAQSPPQAGEAIAAVRQRDQQPAWVKRSALVLESATPVGATEFAVEARARNRLIEAGSALTWVGTAISLVGTALFAVGRIQSNDTIFYTGAFTALAAEPLMWSGTALWIVGALRRPYEAPPPVAVSRPSSQLLTAPTSASLSVGGGQLSVRF